MSGWLGRQSACFAFCTALPITVHAQVAAPLPVTPASTGAEAPAPGSSGERIAKDAERASGLSRETQDPLLRSGARSARSQLIAIATAADKKAKGQLGIDRQLPQGTLQFFLAASTPLAENTQSTTRTFVADLSDLPGVNTGEFGATFTLWRAPSRVDRDAAAMRYSAAQKKVYDYLQTQIDAKENLRPSQAPRKAEDALYAANLKKLDDALKAVNAVVTVQSALTYDPATPAPARATATKALTTAVAERDVVSVARDVEQKRHTDKLAEISAAHAVAEAPLDRDIAALKRQQAPFKQDLTGKIVVLLNANPQALRDPAYDHLVGTDLEEIQRLTRSSTPFMIGLSGSGGRKKYDYVDTLTLAAASQTLTSQQVRVATGVLGSLGFLNAYFSRQRSVTEKDQTQLCRPFGTDGVLRCTNVRMEPPSDKWKNLVGVEFRGPLGPSLMFGLEGTRDTDSKITSWNVPLYFMTDKPGGTLNGGIVVGGRSDQSGLTVKVFVGAVAPPLLR